MPEAVVTPAAQPFVRPTGRFELPPEPTPAETHAPEATPAPAENAGATPDVQDTEDQAPSAKPEATPETPEQAEKRREGRRVGRKLDKAYRERGEAIARAELLARQLDELKQTRQTAAPVTAGEGAPTLAQFEYDEAKFAAAVADHAKAQHARELQTKQAQESFRAQQQRLTAGWEDQIEAAKDLPEDFDQVVPELKPTDAVVMSLMEAGPKVAYHLFKNPAEVKRIAALPLMTQIREIGKLEAKLAAEPIQPKTPSKAPAPITPLSGAASNASSEPSEQDDMKAWVAKRNKQLGRK